MEQKVFSKFNLYDQIGYLMVGAVALLLIVFNGSYFFQATFPLLNIDNFLAWFIVAYFLGHLIQGIANLITDIEQLRFLIPESKSDFDETEKEILQQAKEYFKLEKQNDSKLWNLCYMFANAKDLTGQVQAFNSYYSLYRGWFVIFCLETIFIVPFFAISFSWTTLVIFLISLLFTIIFRRRLTRFWNYTRNKVLETFIVVKTLDL
jgi:hypothetical protein